MRLLAAIALLSKETNLKAPMFKAFRNLKPHHMEYMAPGRNCSNAPLSIAFSASCPGDFSALYDLIR